MLEKHVFVAKFRLAAYKINLFGVYKFSYFRTLALLYFPGVGNTNLAFVPGG